MNPTETYALVIGIDAYAHEKTPNLGAACSDADRIKTFLTETLRVPDENIINLRDGQATRKGILDGFKDLESITESYYTRPGSKAGHTAGDKAGYRPPEPRLGPCMIIFFAGNGARITKPNGWGDWAPDSNYVGILCPSDIGVRLSVFGKGKRVDGNVDGELVDGEPVDGDGNGGPLDGDGDGKGVDSSEMVEGIPHRTVCWLLNQLSEKRGNNITLILDCSYSAGAVCQFPGFGGRFQDSHVLLSACGKKQMAREKDRSGIFTNALMRVLLKEFGSSKKPKLLAPLTYSTLMADLHMPEFQTPHCEGGNINNFLFTRQRAVSDELFIPCRKTQVEIDRKGQKMDQGQKSKQWILTLDAGSAQGIAQGELFSFHENVHPVGGSEDIPTLIATEVRTATSILNHWPDPKKGFHKGKHFYAKRIDWSKDPPKIFCEDPALLDTLFPSNDPTKRIVRVGNKEDAPLTLELTANKVRFLRSNHAFLENCQVPSFTVGVNKHNAIRAAVGGLHHFNSHLHREGEEFPGVRMELHFLEPVPQGKGRGLADEEAQWPESFKLGGNNLLVEEPATLSLGQEEKPLGVTLYNDGDVPIYPYLFYFDPNDLTIAPWYLSPTGAGLGKVDPPLRARSNLRIGCGNTAPWSSHFSNGRTKDVGYFKLFLSTSPINLGSLIRETSPFDEWNKEPPRSDETDAVTKVHLENFNWGAKVSTPREASPPNGWDKGASRSGKTDPTAKVDLGCFTWGAKVFTVIQELKPEEFK